MLPDVPPGSLHSTELFRQLTWHFPPHTIVMPCRPVLCTLSQLGCQGSIPRLGFHRRGVGNLLYMEEINHVVAKAQALVSCKPIDLASDAGLPLRGWETLGNLWTTLSLGLLSYLLKSLEPCWIFSENSATYLKCLTHSRYTLIIFLKKFDGISLCIVLATFHMISLGSMRSQIYFEW